MRSSCLAYGVALLLVSGCGGPSPDPSQDATPAPGIGNAAATRYACGAFPFDASMWQRPGTAELADHPAAAVLRDHLATTDEDGIVLPDHGWTLIGINATGAEFLAPGDADDLMYEVSLSQDGGRWSVAGWGECSPSRVLPAGLNNASWVLAPDQEIGAETTSVLALVTETECASGKSSEGRVVGPEIVELPDRVLVTFAVRALGGDVHTCPGNPETTVQIQLPAPLGPRQLLDGSWLPARDPVKVECCGLQSSGARG